MSHVNGSNSYPAINYSHVLQSRMALQYDYTLRTIIDKHAPVKSKAITIRSEAVWYTEEIHEARRIRRKLERKWRKSGLEVDFQIYTSQRQAVTRLVHKTKTDYYCADIQTNAKDSKLLFKTVDTLLHKSGEPRCLRVTRRPISRTLSRTTSWKGWLSSTRGFRRP